MPEVLIKSKAALSCSPQSQRNEPNISPVKHCELTLTKDSLSVEISNKVLKCFF